MHNATHNAVPNAVHNVRLLTPHKWRSVKALIHAAACLPTGSSWGRRTRTLSENEAKPYLQTVMRFLRSTATFLFDAFFDVRPIAIALWTQAASIRWSLNASSREPPTPPFGPKHTKHTPHTLLHHRTTWTFPQMMLWISFQSTWHASLCAHTCSNLLLHPAPLFTQSTKI